MKKKRKEEILIKARELFNKRGYNEVSMRNVADELGISVGNLTYHFKKKEDLIEEVILYKYETHKKSDPITNLEDLNNMFLDIMNLRSKNAYYFNHYYQLSHISPRIYNLQLDSIREVKEALVDGFNYLIQCDLVKDPILSNQLNNLVQGILAILIYKPVNTAENLENNETENVSECLWSIVFMYLTEKGREKYFKLIDIKTK